MNLPWHQPLAFTALLVLAASCVAQAGAAKHNKQRPSVAPSGTITPARYTFRQVASCTLQNAAGAGFDKGTSSLVHDTVPYQFQDITGFDNQGNVLYTACSLKDFQEQLTFFNKTLIAGPGVSWSNLFLKWGGVGATLTMSGHWHFCAKMYGSPKASMHDYNVCLVSDGSVLLKSGDTLKDGKSVSYINGGGWVTESGHVVANIGWHDPKTGSRAISSYIIDGQIVSQDEAYSEKRIPNPDIPYSDSVSIKSSIAEHFGLHESKDPFRSGGFEDKDSNYWLIDNLTLNTKGDVAFILSSSIEKGAQSTRVESIYVGTVPGRKLFRDVLTPQFQKEAGIDKKGGEGKAGGGN